MLAKPRAKPARYRRAILKRGRQVRYGPRRIDDESQLVNTIAGPYAQRRFAPRSDWRTGNRHFVKAKAKVFRTHGKGTVARKYLAYVEVRAAQVVDDLWIDIKAVAKALLERETLTGREIRIVIRNAQRKRGLSWQRRGNRRP